MFGLHPAHLYHLLALLVPLLGWWLTLPLAQKQHLTILHTSSLAVSYWEELLFRSLILGIVFGLWHSFLGAATVSCLLFGLFHLRNLWWSPRKQVIINCLYAGLFFGPIVCVVRWWTGDIYLGIAIHAIHNFTVMSLPAKKDEPTNSFLLSKQSNMNWFEYLFSGFWLMSK